MLLYLMTMNTTSVDSYLKDGCGRCEHYQTPECKVHLWTPILKGLRKMLLDAGLTETMKWGSPTYTLDGKNVVMIVSMREYCALSFFKGAALKGPKNMLESPGPNSHHVRYLKFKTKADLQSKASLATSFIQSAIEAEKKGIKTQPSPKPTALPEELEAEFKKSGKLKKAFEALTPGRQRSHILYITGAKQSETRVKRAAVCANVIMTGRGWNEMP